MENIKELATLVKQMRDAQKTFFREARQGNKTMKDLALEQSKKLESIVDATVHEILNPVNKSQRSLF